MTLTFIPRKNIFLKRNIRRFNPKKVRMWLLSKKNKKIYSGWNAEEIFADFLLAAHRDVQFREKISHILSLSDFHRALVIASAAKAMQVNAEPKNVIEAFSLLAHPHYAKKAMLELSEHRNSQ